jgi:hypothetical protein
MRGENEEWIRSWAIVVEWVRDNEQWDTETITDVDPDTSAVVDPTF